MNNKMRTIGLVLATLLAAFLLASPAAALEAKITGQVNQMVMYADDGKNSDFFVTDNDNSSTRIRATGEEEVGNGVKAGFQVEIEAQENASNTLSIDTTSTSDSTGFNWGSRWLNVYFDTQYGKFEIGKGDAAANGIAELDLSGTSVAGYSSIDATARDFQFQNDAGTGSGWTIGDAFANFDGTLSRTERIRYNTPNFAGLTVAGAAANGGAWDAAIRYSAEMYGKVVAGVGYTNMQRVSQPAKNYTNIAGSISWLMPFGLNITGSYGTLDYNDSARTDPTNWYVKVGYMTGIHAFAIEYDNCADQAGNDFTGTMYGAAYVVKPWKPVELYAAYRVYMLDVPDSAGSDPKDFSQFYAGTRIKF